jgi:uncharacterized protein (DUF1684 family)
MTHDHDHEQSDEHAHEHHHHHHLSYEDQVAAYREAKDDAFRRAPESPIPEAERAAFAGIPYSPIDSRYRFEDVRLQPYAGSEPIAFQIPMSDGRLRPAHRAGSLTFELDGTPRTLAAYALDGQHSHSLFVPFLDATSGRETYGAGRYMDLEEEDDGTYAIDFNLAYHPSCVYDPKYSCPLTPAENRLPMRIEAGERLAESAG